MELHRSEIPAKVWWQKESRPRRRCVHKVRAQLVAKARVIPESIKYYTSDLCFNL